MTDYEIPQAKNRVNRTSSRELKLALDMPGKETICEIENFDKKHVT